MNGLLELQSVCKIYLPGGNEVRALYDISLQIHAGEFVAIVGNSGSGKSTLMNILGCLDLPTSGRYLLEGNDVSSFNDTQLSQIRNREIGFVFQGFNLIPNLTALENVELPLLYRKIPRTQRRRLALSALAKVGLEHRVSHRPSQMSGGQQQRVAIARAIAAAPPIILADEPTGNLDSHSGAGIIDLLRALHHEGHTILLITHDRQIASGADRIICVQDGRIVGDSLAGTDTAEA